ncbi:tetratricopeptide repeat protein [Aeromicrobium duanguangcaii]|uniref:Tetratricopeptide repeat protein n=1 Tax=Aeromicrobium duanguangcaii TaxID=2968086 RepID=A0ABY5KE34_9ACTN|nr:tetratricopeptide repeat protein [Aeromicrobium duanguangcaii]MCD9155444.1 tetratricopeptide repeat protein [Aeromicrobium duanguangcaii]UUI68293.1 tetratricopeptide repeat protein [Aeromicrobium duanguangcaii]
MAESRNPAGRGRNNNNSGGSRGGSSRPNNSGGSRSAGSRPSSGSKPTGSGSRPSSGGSSRPSSGSKPTGGPRTPGSGARRNSDRPGAPRSSGGPRSASGNRPTTSGPNRDRRASGPDRSDAQKTYDGPPIPDDVSAKDLDKFARQELQGLPDKLADKVARHLVMAGILLHEDPELAHKHALAARARAMRVGLVREATGETAYALGNWAEALAEFRAAKRMTGRGIYAPMMADAERALGRPEKALEYDTPTIRAALDEAGNTELTIVIAGARRDLGQTDAALQLLESEPLNTKSRHDWITRLRYAYADTLAAAGRTDEAITWFHRVAGTDANGLTDAQDRINQLEN